MNISEMNSTQDLNNNSSENERLESVNILDLEAQIKSSSVEPIQKPQIPLKGILKKPIIVNDSDDIKLVAIKICSTICVLIIMVPIIVSDLYFGFTDSTCVSKEPNNFAISMKLYLLVSGFVGMTVLLICITSICCLSNNEDKNLINLLCTTFISYILIIFNIIWNIFGAIVFWGTIYPENICNKNTLMYIFVSLIIKCVGLFISYLQFKKQRVET
jgi:hypothetical protein